MKLNKRGGERTKKKLKSSQSRLIAALFKTRGGVVACEKLLGVSHQNLINWRSRGAVPLNKVIEIAQKLKINPEVLNFEKSAPFFAIENKDWEHCVKMCKFESNITKWVLDGIHPKVKV